MGGAATPIPELASWARGKNLKVLCLDILRMTQYAEDISSIQRRIGKDRVVARRKTLEVSVLRDKINQMLADSDDDKTEGRTVLALVLEFVLMESGNYSGFRFTDFSNGNLDATRRYYYMAGNAR